MIPPLPNSAIEVNKAVRNGRWVAEGRSLKKSPCRIANVSGKVARLPPYCMSQVNTTLCWWDVISNEK